MLAEISTEINNNNKEASVEQHYYDVTFVADRFVITVTAGVPVRDDEADYDDDPSAIDVARQTIIDEHGFDPSAYAFQVLVRAAF
jgi:hypothetical protein